MPMFIEAEPGKSIPVVVTNPAGADHLALERTVLHRPVTVLFFRAR